MFQKSSERLICRLFLSNPSGDLNFVMKFDTKTRDAWILQKIKKETFAMLICKFHIFMNSGLWKEIITFFSEICAKLDESHARYKSLQFSPFPKNIIFHRPASAVNIKPSDSIYSEKSRKWGGQNTEKSNHPSVVKDKKVLRDLLLVGGAEWLTGL